MGAAHQISKNSPYDVIGITHAQLNGEIYFYIDKSVWKLSSFLLFWISSSAFTELRKNDTKKLDTLVFQMKRNRLNWKSIFRVIHWNARCHRVFLVTNTFENIRKISLQIKPNEGEEEETIVWLEIILIRTTSNRN